MKKMSITFKISAQRLRSGLFQTSSFSLQLKLRKNIKISFHKNQSFILAVAVDLDVHTSFFILQRFTETDTNPKFLL